MRSRAHIPLLAAAGAGLLLASASCAKLRGWSRERAISNAAARFHENLKASKFDEIFDGASGDLRARQKKEEFVNGLRAVRARLGDIAGVEESSFPGRQEDAQFNWVITTFHVDGSADDALETMAWDVAGDEVRLDRYSVTFKEGKESINLTP